MGWNPERQSKAEKTRARAEARREAELRAQQHRYLGIALGGVALVVAVAVFVVVLIGQGDGDGTGPSAPGEVTVQGSPRATPLQAGEAVPAFTAPELAGGTVEWSTYAGKPVVLSVWASWCPHCQVELPVLDRVMKDYAGVGFVTIVTATGVRPGPTPEEYMLENQLDFPVAVDDEGETLAAALGIQGFPTLYFVDSDGTVAAQLSGEVAEADLRSTIESLT